jgi:ribose 5-phosphate isomerase RpiB
MSSTDRTVQEIYQNIVAILPLSDRLRMAALILNDLTQQNVAVIDVNDTWTEQDQLDLTSFSLQYANSVFPNEEDMA